MRVVPIVVGGLLLLCTSACTNEITASLKVDGVDFVPSSCRSGQVNNFMGVDLVNDAGDIVRLVQPPTNQPHVILFRNGKASEVGTCGTMSIGRQNSTINNVANVQGDATLACEAGGHKIAGTVTFKNCH
ncbi:MAG: hypothetical protein ACPG4T_11300 [Nannocystaceae bacterium]